tara:strand:+ start:5700 stop:6476 length:777 start_codon:yes stop_codon:yes gene_type:complete
MINRILFLIITIVIFIILFNYNYKNIYVLSKKELIAHLLNYDDNYFDRFNNTDLKVRNVNNIKEYKINIVQAVCNPSNDIILKLKKCAIHADNILEKMNSKYDSNIHGVDINKLKDIKWKFGIICNDLYENGLPHTRGDVIVINSQQIYNTSIQSLSNTLIHEKVHIYQKMYKSETKSYIKNNFKVIKTVEKADNIRANPDTDNFIYVDFKDRIYKAEYLPDSVHIKDVRLYNNNQEFEHPLESAAVLFSNKASSFSI